MPAEPKAAQKRPRLPFKPPSRTSNAEPSVALKPKEKTKQTSAKASASSSTPKQTKPKPTTKPTKTTKSATATGKRSRVESPSPDDSHSVSNKTTNSATGKRPRIEPTAADGSQSGSESDSDTSGRDRSRSLSQEPDYILAEITTTNPTEDVISSDPTIPPKLLTRLLHHHFQNDKTKVAKDANSVVAKYVDVFVREAIARAAYERAETNDHAGGRSVGDGFLEVGHSLSSDRLYRDILIKNIG
jgi:hypothetical protein